MSDISMGNKNSGNVSNSRIGKRVLSIGLAAILVLSSIVVALPVKAQAAPTITTSTDKFFGPSLVRVLITDPAKANNTNSGTADRITVDIEVRDKNNNLKGTLEGISVNEIENSGQYELYIAAHTEAFPNRPTNKNPDNSVTLNNDGYTIVRIHSTLLTPTPPSGHDPIQYTLTLSSTPAELESGDKIKITYAGAQTVSKVLTFEPTSASVTVDRTLAGQENKIRIKLNDKDANLDPTGVDEFSADTTNNITASNLPTGSIFNITKGAGTIKWKETGENTGVFELVVVVGVPADTTNDTAEIVPPATGLFPSSVTFTVTDNDVYHKGTDTYPNGDTLASKAKAPFTTLPKKTTSTPPPVVVQLRNSDGSIDLTAPLTIANGFQIKVTDPDQNRDTTVKDEFSAQVSINGVTLPPGPSGIVFKETDDNTNIFLPDLAGNKIQIVPRAGTTLTLPSGVSIAGVIEFKDANNNNAYDIGEERIVLGTDNKIYVLASAIKDDPDLTISYNDPAADPSGPKEFKIVRKIQHFAGSISTTTTSVPVTGKAVIEINDMDLNLNPDAIDIYTLTISTNNSPVASFNGLAELTVKVNGKDKVAFASGTTIQLVETGANTGIFRGEFSVDKITDKDTDATGTQALADGDKITFEYKDLTESPALTRSVDVKIGKPSGTVELDRSSYPPTTSLGTTKLHITITDPSFNSSSSSTDVLQIGAGQPNGFTGDTNNNKIFDSGETITFNNGSLRLQLIKGGTTITLLPGFTGFPESANETGVNTGVFTIDVDLPQQVTIGPTTTHTIGDGWQIRVVYKDSNGDDQTATATVTTNTAQVTTDKPTYDLGQTIILRVVEPDWNFDSDKVDEIELKKIGIDKSSPPDGDAVDDEDERDFVVNSDKVSDRHIATLGGISGISLDPSSTIRETGKNTGIFEIKIKDINSNLVSRGKNLEFTYTDRTPSGGGTEVEVKHTVLITSATVDIIFDKETYTPFDRVLVSIVDPAANQDPDTKDKFTGTDARVRVIVGGTSQTLTSDFEETEANSGVFRYKPNDKGILITSINPNAKPGDGIRVEYRSPDKQTEISKSVPIVFNNGSISLDKDSYKPGETVVITINDPDENRNPDIPDQFEVKVVSTTDPTGIKVTVRETGDRTGVFKAEVILTTGLSSGNRLQVREGDQITAIYTDETLPNAQTINQQLVNRNQVGLRTLQTLDVQASAVVGVLLAPTERTTVAKPSLRDQAGNVLTQASVDVPVSIASSIKNNTQQPQKFVYIVQVKDADGFVVSISTVGGTLPAGQSFDVSASWTPTAPGTYTVEVFVWTELGKPSPLSKVETATVRVV
jgi:hypothetical protein